MTDSSKPADKAGNGSTVELLSFLVGGQDYCVDIMSVREIRGPPFCRMPRPTCAG
jgi:purine-binding chemotaxis protein CheW